MRTLLPAMVCRLHLLVHGATLALTVGTMVAPMIAQPPPARGAPGEIAESIYFNGNILTGKGLDSNTPQRVSAIAVGHGMVLDTGGDTGSGDGTLEAAGAPYAAEPKASKLPARLRARKGPHTRMIDLDGAFLMPGLNDAHVHLGEAGRIKLSVDLIGAASLQEMIARIKTAAVRAPAGTWLTGGGWDHTLWAEKVLPGRFDLDAVTAGHPAIFTRIDGHIAVANSAALAAAGITSSTPDPAGGKIDRLPPSQSTADQTGTLATGILREDSAMSLVRSHIPPPTEEMRRRGLELAIADALSHGVTSVQDNSDMEDLRLYGQMEREGRLPIRITEWLPFDAPLERLKQLRAAYPAGDRMLHTGMLKGFMDGSLGSRTAAMKAPFADNPGNDPGNVGLPRYEQATLNRMTVERTEAGFQIGFHAIGDRAASMALDAFTAASEARTRLHTIQSPTPTVHTGIQVTNQTRNRIEHAQVVDAADIERFRQLGVIASMQPNHLLTDMNWAEQRLGPERARSSYAWKAFLDAGVPLAFGTDYPVEPVNPFRGIYSAVTRQNEAATASYFPENKLNIGQALHAYTQGSAYAEFSELWKGKLAPGYVADFVILDRDLTKVPAASILKTKVLETVVGGKTAYVAHVQAR